MYVVECELVECRPAVEVGGVAHQGVEPAQPFHGAPHSVEAERLLAQVAGDEQAPPPLGLDALAHDVGVRLLAGKIRDRDIRSLPGVEERDGAADTGITAGDERDLAGQLARRPVSRGPVARRRVDLGLQARVRQPLLGKRRGSVPR